MAEESIVSKPVMVLGEALRPIARMMEKRMLDVPARTERQDDVLEFVLRHVRKIENDLVALADEFNGQLVNAIAADGDDAAIWRAAARFEMRIERLLDSYDEVRRVEGDARDAPGLSLLGDVYRELLNKAREWLDEILDVVDDPARAVRKRGLAAEGDAKLKIKLKLEAANQFDSLLSWYRLRAEERSRPGRDQSDVPRVQAANRGSRRRHYGVLALVMSAFGLGWLMGGDDE